MQINHYINQVKLMDFKAYNNVGNSLKQSNKPWFSPLCYEVLI
jgi:hypothetical protein